VNIYSRKQRWKILLFIAAVIIVAISLWYTNQLVKKISTEERRKVQLWVRAIQQKGELVNKNNKLYKEEQHKIEKLATAYRKLLSENADDYTDALEVIGNNISIPIVILDDEQRVILTKNIEPKKVKDSVYMNMEVDTMKAQHEPFTIDLTGGKKHFLYYKNSQVFSLMKNVYDDFIGLFKSDIDSNAISAPVILTDSMRKHIIAYSGIDSLKIKEPVFVESKITSMEGEHGQITVNLGDQGPCHLFYEDSFLLTQLKYYPYMQFSVIGLFLFISYLLFSTSRRAEQNQVWVGMAKETAHQLGTPLSSLMAWIEVLRMKGVDEQTMVEMRQDLGRLETITERFSKIGSMPVLEKQDVVAVLNKSVDYIRTRTSKNVSFDVKGPAYTIHAGINVPLFEWVIENICKNAVDAMDGKGSITIEVSDLAQFVYIDIKDSGKGIPKSKFKTVFEPGYTTKERGWGLGLSLVKRIIENYHAGKIFVKGSEPGKGTTFRIVLNK
jgi:anti-sigma regulatory factor (Ser/Thr protein kinase)